MSEKEEEEATADAKEASDTGEEETVMIIKLPPSPEPPPPAAQDTDDPGYFVRTFVDSHENRFLETVREERSREITEAELPDGDRIMIPLLEIVTNEPTDFHVYCYRKLALFFRKEKWLDLITVEGDVQEDDAKEESFQRFMGLLEHIKDENQRNTILYGLDSDVIEPYHAILLLWYNDEEDKGEDEEIWLRREMRNIENLTMEKAAIVVNSDNLNSVARFTWLYFSVANNLGENVPETESLRQFQNLLMMIFAVTKPDTVEELSKIFRKHILPGRDKQWKELLRGGGGVPLPDRFISYIQEEFRALEKEIIRNAWKDHQDLLKKIVKIRRHYTVGASNLIDPIGEKLSDVSNEFFETFDNIPEIEKSIQEYLDDPARQSGDEVRNRLDHLDLWFVYSDAVYDAFKELYNSDLTTEQMSKIYDEYSDYQMDLVPFPERVAFKKKGDKLTPFLLHEAVEHEAPTPRSLIKGLAREKEEEEEKEEVTPLLTPPESTALQKEEEKKEAPPPPPAESSPLKELTVVHPLPFSRVGSKIVASMTNALSEERKVKEEEEEERGTEKKKKRFFSTKGGGGGYWDDSSSSSSEEEGDDLRRKLKGRFPRRSKKLEPEEYAERAESEFWKALLRVLYDLNRGLQVISRQYDEKFDTLFEQQTSVLETLRRFNGVDENMVIETVSEVFSGLFLRPLSDIQYNIDTVIIYIQQIEMFLEEYAKGGNNTKEEDTVNKGIYSFADKNIAFFHDILYVFKIRLSENNKYLPTRNNEQFGGSCPREKGQQHDIFLKGITLREYTETYLPLLRSLREEGGVDTLMKDKSNSKLKILEDEKTWLRKNSLQVVERYPLLVCCEHEVTLKEEVYRWLNHLPVGGEIYVGVCSDHQREISKESNLAQNEILSFDPDYLFIKVGLSFGR